MYTISLIKVYRYIRFYKDVWTKIFPAFSKSAANRLKDCLMLNLFFIYFSMSALFLDCLNDFQIEYGTSNCT